LELPVAVRHGIRAARVTARDAILLVESNLCRVVTKEP
jgi:hypothetical protein